MRNSQYGQFAQQESTRLGCLSAKRSIEQRITYCLNLKFNIVSVPFVTRYDGNQALASSSQNCYCAVAGVQQVLNNMYYVPGTLDCAAYTVYYSLSYLIPAYPTLWQGLLGQGSAPVASCALLGRQPGLLSGPER